ncbi:MAG: hypothetical protein GF398_18165 [Chitinivibrionales bacterium]|nr:hypothetical protein [Chitinivibrionales bacterium]
MKLAAQNLEVLNDYFQDPRNASAASKLSSLYWSTIADSLGDSIHNNRDVAGFIERERDFINYARVEANGFNHLQKGCIVKKQTKSDVQIFTFADWLFDLIEKINQVDMKAFLIQEIKAYIYQKSQFKKELKQCQSSRKKMLTEELNPGGEDATFTMQIGKLPLLDSLLMQKLVKEKEVETGSFYSPGERKEFAHLRTTFAKEADKYDNLAGFVRNDVVKKQLRKMTQAIEEISRKIVNADVKIASLKEEIGVIEQQQTCLSPLEFENKIREEIEYVRDLAKLCAKRIHAESCPFAVAEEVLFTPDKIQQTMQRVLEFDPHVFHNDRVVFMGKPHILVVPGYGYGTYDWKGNRFIIPLRAPRQDFSASLTNAVIEYRLDVDEEKSLITSYARLPHCKGVRSVLQIKGYLIKDYIGWINSESRGYKILPRETRAWIESEVAPSKNDIYCPHRYQYYNLAPAKFKKLLEIIDDKVKNGLEHTRASDLWLASILYYHTADYEKAYECICAFLNQKPDYKFGYYNKAQIAQKLNRRQDAIEAFDAFCKRIQQSWWGYVARGHLTRLRV